MFMHFIDKIQHIRHCLMQCGNRSFNFFFLAKTLRLVKYRHYHYLKNATSLLQSKLEI